MQVKVWDRSYPPPPSLSPLHLHPSHPSTPLPSPPHLHTFLFSPPPSTPASPIHHSPGELGQIRDALEANAGLMDSCGLAPLLPLFSLPNLANVSGAITPADMTAARAALSDVEPDPTAALGLIRRIGCTYCQAQRHGFQAYNPLVQQSAALADVLLYGAIVPLEGREIQAPKREISSRMVQIANDADEAMRQANVEIPLFW